MYSSTHLCSVEKTLLTKIRELTGDWARQQFYKTLELSIWRQHNIWQSKNVSSVAEENILRTLLTAANKENLIN
jgi:hypothetical protein